MLKEQQGKDKKSVNGGLTKNLFLQHYKTSHVNKCATIFCFLLFAYTFCADFLKVIVFFSGRLLCLENFAQKKLDKSAIRRETMHENIRKNCIILDLCK